MLVPKLFTTLKTYTRRQLLADTTAGVIVGIVALPLAIAFAIASGVTRATETCHTERMIVVLQLLGDGAYASFASRVMSTLPFITPEIGQPSLVAVLPARSRLPDNAIE
ncbi:MAG: hypothetical protein Q8Q85_09960 [Gemmatimonadales bacterium]|nr:hypothetical protein [Gemmatimonadales bacterium]